MAVKVTRLDGNVSQANSCHMCYGYKWLNQNGVGIATNPRSTVITFSQANTVIGVVAGIGAPSTVNITGDLRLDFQENVSGTWTTRATKTYTANEIKGASSGVIGAYRIYWPLSVPVAVDTAANKWRTLFTDVSQQGWAVAGSTVSELGVFCVSNTQASYTVSDDLIVNNSVNLDVFPTAAGNKNLWVCSGATLNFLDNTAPYYGSISWAKNSVVNAGSSASRFTNFTLHFDTSTQSFVGELGGANAGSGSLTLVTNCASPAAVRFYGSKPANTAAKMHSGIAVGATSFEVAAGVDVSDWTTGDPIYFTRYTTATKGQSTPSGGTEYTVSGTPTYNAGTGRYTVNFTPALTTNAVPASGAKHPTWVKNFRRGIVIDAPGGSYWSLLLTNMAEMVVDGVRLENYFPSPTASFFAGTVDSDPALKKQSRFVDVCGRYPITNNRGALANGVPTAPGFRTLVDGFDFVGMPTLTGTVPVGVDIKRAWFTGANNVTTTISSGDTLEDFVVVHSGVQITVSSAAHSVNGFYGWGCSTTGTNGVLMLGSSNYDAKNIVIDNCGRAVQILTSLYTMVGRGQDWYLGTEYANTVDIAFDAYCIDAVVNGFSATLGGVQSSLLAPSLLVTNSVGGDAEDSRAYAETMTTTSKAYAGAKMSVRHINALLTASPAYRMLSGAVAGQKFAASVTANIQNAAYYAGAYALPAIAATWDNGSTASGAATATTGDQTISLAGVFATDRRELKLSLNSKTDALTSAGDVVWSSLRVVTRQYGYIYRDTSYTLQRPYAVVEVLDTLPSKAANPLITNSDGAAALAVTGIAANHGAQVFTISAARSFAQLYDWTQADLAQDANMLKAEWLISTDGGVSYNASGWRVVGLANVTAPKRLTNATVPLAAAGTYALVLGTVTLELGAAGTYNLRGSDITGTVTLVGTGVTVLLLPGVSYIAGPGVTVDNRALVTLTAANIPAGASVLLRNETQDTEIDVQIAIASAYGFDLEIGTDADVGDVLSLRAIKASGTTYSRYYEVAAVVPAAGGQIEIIDPWETWAEATALGVNGAAVLDFDTDFTNIRVQVIDASAPGFWGKEMIAFTLYKTASEAEGMRKWFGALTAQNAARWVIDVSKVNLWADNMTALSTKQTDEVIVLRSDGQTPELIPSTGGGGCSFAIANDVASLLPTAAQNASAVRAALSPELTQVTDIAKLHGAVSGVPLVVSDTARTAGSVVQSVVTDGAGTTTVLRT